LTKIAAALPRGAPPERVTLLPQILRVWAQEDLREHLLREGRADVRQREERLQAVKKQAKDLLNAVEALDKIGRFEVVLRPQMRRAGTGVWNTDIDAADRRRDQAVSWLNDLIEAFEEPRPKAPPDRKTKHYLVMLDLAAIFELISGEPARRRTDADEGVPYGPYWNFAEAFWSAVYGNQHGLQNAVRIWADEVSRQTKLVQSEVARAEEALGRPLERGCDKTVVEAIMNRCRSYSPFVANLQFRHRSLWRKLRGTPQ
jgi:hypothetical protein